MNDKSMIYVGLAATFHDPALAIVDANGQPLFAEAAERRLQDKRAYNAPPDSMLAIADLIRFHAGNARHIVLAINWSREMVDHLDRIGAAQLPTDASLRTFKSWPAPSAPALEASLRHSIVQAGTNLAAMLGGEFNISVRRYAHHRAHAALAAFGSGFDRCAVAVLDGFGEGTAASFYTFDSGELAPLDGEAPDPGGLPGSLGELYSLLCGLCGFDVTKGEEWKVMGLAAYGRSHAPTDALLRPLFPVDGLAIRRAGDFPVRLLQLMSAARAPGTAPLDYADVAHAGQVVFEDAVVEILGRLRERTGLERLAYTGGCALNSSCNGKILARTGFESLYVPSAPADDGTALGAAWLAYAEDHGPPAPGSFLTPFLGSRPSRASVARLRQHGGLLTQEFADDSELYTATAAHLADGKIVAWMRGCAEFGPRALGHRSILADPRDPQMGHRINEQVKFREAFRPFAPAILDEHGPEFFEDYQRSPYMDRTLRFRPEAAKRVPAVVHVDGTGRLQSLSAARHPDLHGLTSAFHARTGVPVLLNTSLNVMGKPIAHTVEDALSVFLTSGIDVLVIDQCLFQKPRRP